MAEKKQGIAHLAFIFAIPLMIIITYFAPYLWVKFIMLTFAMAAIYFLWKNIK